MQNQARRATNISLDASLLIDARMFKINLSRAAEDGVRRAVEKARADQWLAENGEAVASSNQYVEEHGLPLAELRQF